MPGRENNDTYKKCKEISSCYDIDQVEMNKEQTWKMLSFCEAEVSLDGTWKKLGQIPLILQADQVKNY